MSSLLLPFAKHVPTGKTVAPEEVERGNACNCECLFCGAPMQARQGDEKAYHFAHQPKKVDDDQPCPASFERCIFWMTKRILEDGSEIALPAHSRTFSDFALDLEVEYPITEASRPQYKLTHFPKITDEPNERFTIEIQINGHKINLVMGNRSLFFNPSEPTVLISMDYIERTYKEQKQGFLNAMNELILDSTHAKEWLYHSKVREEQRKEEFETLVEEEKARIAAKLEAERKAAEQVAERRRARFTTRRPKANPLLSEADTKAAYSHQRHQDRLNPHLAERIAGRLRELVRLAKVAAESGAESGWQCRTCYVVTTVKPRQCPHCDHSEIQPFDFSEENMSHLENKFYCGNFAAKSIEAAPILILK